MARDAVFRSWQNERAKHYRRINNIDDMLALPSTCRRWSTATSGYQRHGRRFHAQPRDRHERVLRRISDERAGRGCSFGRAHSGADPRTAENHACCLRSASRNSPHGWKSTTKTCRISSSPFRTASSTCLQTRTASARGLAAVRVAIQMVEERTDHQGRGDLPRRARTSFNDFLVAASRRKEHQSGSARDRTAGFARSSRRADRLHRGRSSQDGWTRHREEACDSGARRDDSRRYSWHGSREGILLRGGE